MDIQTRLKDVIAPYHLLKHPFYQAWMQGELTQEQLKHYAAQYYPHVSAFPRFVSAIHSLCMDPVARKAMFLNLSEEEGAGYDADHPELWLRFAEGLGASRSQVQGAIVRKKARALVDVYFELCRSSYAEGLGALIAYESQVPEIAEAKIEGLKRFYGINDARVTAFFDVHKSADVLHSESCARLLGELPVMDQDAALRSVEKASRALWDFLTEVYESDHREAA